MRRVVVLGGLGLFGRLAAGQLREQGIQVCTASRGCGADLRVDANVASSIRAALRSDDLIVDAAGPFQARSMALVEAAVEIGFDVIDLNDSLSYAEHLVAMTARIAAAKIRVLSGASTVSAVAASVLRYSRISEPRCVTAFLAPATRYTANAGTARSLLESVGRPVRVWRDGSLKKRWGWSKPREYLMPPPVGAICGRLFESADALNLPRIWPTLRDVSMCVDTNTLGLNAALRAVGVVPGLRGILARQMWFAAWLARSFGSSAGGVGYEIESTDGRMVRYAFVGRERSRLVAVAPAVLATRAILDGRFAHCGLVSPDRHVEPEELIKFLLLYGIIFSEPM